MPREPRGHVPKSLEGTGDNNVRGRVRSMLFIV